jgi:hypothetical protein
MSRSLRILPVAGVLAAWAAVAALGGCQPENLLPRYDGPMPSTEPVLDEVVVVRGIRGSPGDPDRVHEFFADRVRFVEAGTPHDVNRIVLVETGDLAPGLAGLQVGDSLLISTLYLRTVFTEVPPTPDWPGHTHPDYPIGFHALQTVAPVGP